MRCPFLFALLLPLLWISTARADLRGDFSARLEAAQLDLSLSYGGSHHVEETLPRAGWKGWASVESAQPRLTLERGAGSLELDGRFSNGTGSGAFRFTPNPAFVQMLQTRGAAPSERDLFELFLFDVGPSEVKALAEAGYPNLGLEELKKAGIFKVTPAVIGDLSAAGFAKLSFEQLVQSRIFHVDGKRIAGYRALVPQLSFDDAIRLATFQVDAGFAEQFRKLGYRNLSAEALCRFRIFKVTPEQIEGFARLGYRQLPPDSLIAFRIHGVTPEYAQALARHGYSGLSPDQLVSLRIHGVTPEFISELEREGAKPSSADELVRIRLRGVERSGARGD